VTLPNRWASQLIALAAWLGAAILLGVWFGGIGWWLSGALAFYVAHANPQDYQPSNITFGIMEPPPAVIRDRQKRKQAIADRALLALAEWDGEAVRA